VSWFKDRYREDTLKIKLPYQRKPVWAARQKCYLIESILMGLPIPEIYIQQITSPEGTTIYNIVDGQQRIRTVLQFIGSETELDEQGHNKFALDKLSPNSKWKNLTFADLSDEEKKSFYGYRFGVRLLITENEAEVRDMLMRLNKFLTPLNAQELRNATYSGPFFRLAENLAESDYWAENRIVKAAAIRRMNDIEFVSELLIGVLHGPQGGSGKVIDEYYKQYEDYDEEFPEQRSATKLFNQTLQTVQAVLPSIKETRWSNKTDFYTLFLVVAALLRRGKLRKQNFMPLRKRLGEFADEVNRRLSDGRASVTDSAVRYVRAVEKAANDKRRRADRHEALMGVIKEILK